MLYTRLSFLLALHLIIAKETTGQVKAPNKDTGLFYEWQNTNQAHKDLNIIGVGPWKVNGEWEIPPLVEGQIRQDFPLMRGRDNQRPWKRSLAVNFNLGLNLRMYQGPGYDSYPVLPINFMAPGLSVDYFLNHLPSLLFNREMRDDWVATNFFNLRFKISHYSNGQSGNYYVPDSSTTNKLNGNFSTNFLQTELSWSRYVANHLLTTKLSYRHDVGIGDALGIEEGLSKSYGKDRLGFVLQLRTKDIALGRYNYGTAVYRKKKGYTTADLLMNKQRPVRYGTFLLRAEVEYIPGNLEYYPTLKNPANKKLRGSIRFTAAYYPANMRTFGVFSQVYYGRDYYNIRFTDELLNIKAGFVMDLNTYIPRRRHYFSQEAIDQAQQQEQAKSDNALDGSEDEER